MRHFYQQVHVDPTSMRFYAECPLCGKKQYAGKIPLLCRKKSHIIELEAGHGKKIRQAIYNHKKAATVQNLTLLFNLSRKHAMWICDQCFEPEYREEF